MTSERARLERAIASLDPQDRNELLCRECRNGSRAASALLIELNRGLVWTVIGRLSIDGIPSIGRDDLFQEGARALLSSPRNYDPDRGAFSTYAAIVIRRHLIRYIKLRGHLITIPVWPQDQLGRYLDACDRLQRALGRQPTRDELGRALGLSLSEVRRVECAERASRATQQLGNGGDEHEAMPVLIDARFTDPLAAAERHELWERLLQHIGELDERERYIITLRYGLEGTVKSVLEIGRALGLCSRRIHQLETAAIRKLLTLLTSASVHRR